MSDIKYVVRFFTNDQYLYSVHCDADILDELLENAKASGFSVKVVAYKFDSDSSVSKEV